MSYVLKIALAGDGSVGKTAIRENFMGKRFQSTYLMTVGADFSVKELEIDGRKVKFQIWDLAGQPRFSQVRSVYYNGTAGALLLFDVTRPETFTNLPLWLDEIWKYSGISFIPVIIMGNKTDLRGYKPDSLTDETAEQFVKNLNVRTISKGFNVSYFPTSAKTGLNVNICFEELGKLCLGLFP